MVHFIIFCIDNQKIALNLEDVESVIPIVEITSLPNGPDNVDGVINMHGNVIPVFNVRRLLKKEIREVDLDDQLIICEANKYTAALWVDSVQGVVSEHLENLTHSENLELEKGTLMHILNHGDEIIPIFDIEQIVSADLKHLVV